MGDGTKGGETTTPHTAGEEIKPRTAAAPPAPHLAAEHADARDGGLALRGRHLLELLVAPDDGEHVHVLPLVLVDALDLVMCENVCAGFEYIHVQVLSTSIKECDKVWNLIQVWNLIRAPPDEINERVRDFPPITTQYKYSQAADLDVEHGVDGDVVPRQLLHQGGQLGLALQLHRAPLGLQVLVACQLAQAREQLSIVDPE